MGQKPSHTGGRNNKAKLPISWILRSHQATIRTPNPEQPIKFQYKTRRKSGGDPHQQKPTLLIGRIDTFNNLNNLGITNNHSAGGNVNSVNLKNKKANDIKCQLAKTQNVPTRTKSEPTLFPEKSREKHRHRRKSARSASRYERKISEQFGYEIEDVDAFLTKATIEKPANIPVVLAFPTVLYQTRTGGYQVEIQLPLGMVVNAVFKNQNWLYVQTPHAEEGYVSYAACLPLGIIPPPEGSPVPCWEKSTDVFPKPSGNMTDSEKLSSRSECSASRCHSSRRLRNTLSTCGERSVDGLYLQAAACSKIKGSKRTLLVVYCDYVGKAENTLSVLEGDVVALIDSGLKGWFWVKDRNGVEGFIPSAVAGDGFL